MLEDFTRLGYISEDFHTYSANERHLLLRHDVDISLSSAVELAIAEYDSGWKATYFFMISTEFYNLCSKAGRAALRRVAEVGHEIALHFDCAAYEQIDAIDKCVAQECDVLEQLIGKPVRVVAPHRPAATCQHWLGMPQLVAGRWHVYHPRYFHDGGYVSDSAGWWAYGHPLQHPQVTARRGIQILTHPHLWCGNASESRDVRLRQLVMDCFGSIQKAS